MKIRTFFACLALAGSLAVPSFASAQMMGPNAWSGYHGSYNGDMYNHRVMARIESVNGNAITLMNGRTVYLHQGTVINPTGIRLRRGMRVAIHGSRTRDGWSADQITVIRGRMMR